MKLLERNNKIKELREKGKSYQEIGNTFKISRQRVEQIINKKIRTRLPYFLTNKFQISFFYTVLKDKYIPSEIYSIYKNNPILKELPGRDFLAEIVRIRDDHTCQICGRVWIEGERRFDTHHLDPNKESILTYANYKNFNEMITLCHKCHLNLPQVREKMKKENRCQTLLETI